MQNKRGASESKFLADLLQLHLLKERKEIISKNPPDCIFGNPKILSEAVLPSVGSYGIFYETDAKRIEMAYYPASQIKLNNPTGGKSRTVYYEDYLFGKVDIDKKSGYGESQGERTLEAFGNALVNMKIGTPIVKTNPAIGRLTQFLYSNSTVFHNALGDNNSFDIHIPQSPIHPVHIPFTCVINAGLVRN